MNNIYWATALKDVQAVQGLKFWMTKKLEKEPVGGIARADICIRIHGSYKKLELLNPVEDLLRMILIVVISQNMRARFVLSRTMF